MRVWTLQDSKQKKHGDKCPWSVGWYDPDGNRKQKSIGSKSMAEKFRRKVEGELVAGVYQSYSRTPWERFHTEYQTTIMSGMEPTTREQTATALKHFERIISPKYIDTIKAQTIDDYVAKRSQERERQQGISCDDQRGTPASASGADDCPRLGVSGQSAEVRNAERAGETTYQRDR